LAVSTVYRPAGCSVPGRACRACRRLHKSPTNAFFVEDEDHSSMPNRTVAKPPSIPSFFSLSRYNSAPEPFAGSPPSLPLRRPRERLLSGATRSPAPVRAVLRDRTKLVSRQCLQPDKTPWTACQLSLFQKAAARARTRRSVRLGGRRSLCASPNSPSH